MRAITASVAIATVFASTACYTMRLVTLDDIEAQPSSRVWVTHQDQSVLVVEGPQVFRGNLVGFVDGTYRELPPTELQNMRVRKLAAGRTMSLVAAGILGFAVTAVVLSGSEAHFDPCAGDEDCVEPLRSSR